MVLNPDQIVDLSPLRLDKLHTCTSNIGKPAGMIEVEIQLEGDDEFRVINPAHTKFKESTDGCMVSGELTFGLSFTSEMYNATVRCKVTNNQFPADPPIYSNTEKLLLVSSKYITL